MQAACRLEKFSGVGFNLPFVGQECFGRLPNSGPSNGNALEDQALNYDYDQRPADTGDTPAAPQN